MRLSLRLNVLARRSWYASLYPQALSSRMGSPAKAVRSRDATIEFFELGETAVVHDCQRIAVTLDICGVSMPPLCQFRFFLVVGEEKVDPEGMELIGAEKLWTIGGRIAVNLCATLPGSQG
jgi:hypothetical protein